MLCCAILFASANSFLIKPPSLKVCTESFTSYHTFCDLNSICHSDWRLFLLPRELRDPKTQLCKANTTPLGDLRAGCGWKPNCKESVSSVWCYTINRVSWCGWETKCMSSNRYSHLSLHVLGSCSISGTFVKLICHYPVTHGRWLMLLEDLLQ